MRRGLRLATIAALACCALTPWAATAQTRVPPTAPTGSPRDRALEDKMRSDEIERVKRAAEKPDAYARAHDARFPQIKEDFERIQVVNAEVLQPSASAAAPDYTRISEAAAEVRKRAARLKSQLFPADAEAQADAGKQTADKESGDKAANDANDAKDTKDTKDAAGKATADKDATDGQPSKGDAARGPEPEGLKPLLSALDDAINDFVHNPLFTNLQVVNAGHSALARRDLERILRLSARLRKEADKMKKSGGG